MADKTPTDSPGAVTPKTRTCGTMPVHERMLRTVPGYREARDASETHAWRASMTPFMGRTGCTKIPVVVHVVYKTAAQNISDAQIKSQIDVLNADYRKKNSDVNSTPAAFAALATDARIQFELATVDPNGAATTGITRTTTTKDSFSDDDAVKSAASGGADAWPRDKYLNVWVCQLGGGLLGYAQFPGGPAATDGVVILHSAFGTNGTAAAPFNLGRSATHEIGHWLNLRHIWGDDGTGCSGDDFVADTPNQGGPNYGTPGFPHISCNNGPNGDMFMNYMDYVDDDAMFMFSAGQVTRMQATLDGMRSTIGTSVSCGKAIPKDIPKEFVKEPPKEHIKEGPKDPIKDHPKDLPKDHPKDLIKEPPKELPKDPPKEFPKDPPKEFPKDLHKDLPKDFPKELHKDGIFDPPKSVFDPPKSIVDPPKSFFEPPIDLGGVVSQPGIGVTGAMPFVLATPAGQHAMPQAAQAWQAASRQQNAALVNGYQTLLAHYARLYSAGQLDAAGLAAWQEAAASYQRIVSQITLG
jgi:hypothetical protein